MTDLDASLRLRLIDEASPEARRIAGAMDSIGTASTSAAAEATHALGAMEAAGSGAVAEARALQAATVGASAGERALAQAAREDAVAQRGAAREARQQAAAQREIERDAKRAATAQQAAARATRSADMQKRMGYAETVNMISEAAFGFAGLNPQVREFATGLAMGGNNAVQLARILPGIWGSVAGLAMGLLGPVLSNVWSNATDGADEHRDAVERVRRTYLETIDAIVQMGRERERQQQLKRGEGELEEQQAVAQHAQDEMLRAERAAAAQRRNVEGQMLRSRRFGGVTGELVDPAAEIAQTMARREDWSRLGREERIAAVRSVVSQDARFTEATEGPGAFAQSRSIAAMASQMTDSEAAVVRARQHNDRAQEGMQAARARHEEQQRVEERERLTELRDQRSQAARGDMEAILDVHGITGRRRSGLLASQRPLTEDQRRALGPDAERFDAARGTVEELRVAGARARLDRAETQLPTGAEVSQEDLRAIGEGSAPAREPIVERARRVMAPRPAQAAAPRGPSEDERFGRAVDDFVRATGRERAVRVIVEDRRVRTEVVDAGAPDAWSQG